MDSADEWARRAAAGNQDAFERLFDATYDAVHAFAYRLLGQTHDADDVAQETFIRAARSLASFRGTARVKTWLLAIALNVVRDRATKSKRRESARADYAEMLRRSVPPDDLRHDVSDALRLVRRLPETLRQAVVLTACEGLSHLEAAQIMGCAESTISWRVHEARRRLTAMLDRCDGRTKPLGRKEE